MYVQSTHIAITGLVPEVSPRDRYRPPILALGEVQIYFGCKYNSTLFIARTYSINNQLIPPVTTLYKSKATYSSFQNAVVIDVKILLLINKNIAVSKEWG